MADGRHHRQANFGETPLQSRSAFLMLLADFIMRLQPAHTGQRARAWDFNGVQGGYQANAKFVHEDAAGKLTVFFD